MAGKVPHTKQMSERRRRCRDKSAKEVVASSNESGLTLNQRSDQIDVLAGETGGLEAENDVVHHLRVKKKERMEDGR